MGDRVTLEGGNVERERCQSERYQEEKLGKD